MGLTINIGRATNYPAASNYDGSGDLGLHCIFNNGASNHAAYVMKSAYIKAKNVGTVGQMVGLEVEQQQRNTCGTSTIVRLRDTASASAYKLDMGDGVTSTAADIRFPNGALVLNSDASTLQITEAVVDVIGQPRDDGKALVCAPSTATLVMDTGDTRITGDGSVTQAFSITFGAAPKVAALYSESGATDILYTASITASNFVLHGTATNAVNWIAVGVR